MNASQTQRGQAMVEMLIVAALVLVPLFLAIPIIAKYMDIRSHVVQAARYASWERTVWFGGAAAKPMGFGTGSFSNKWDANEKTDAAITAEIGARILSNTGPGDFFTSNDASAGSFAGGGKPLWVDRRGNALLADYSDIGNKTDNNPSPGLFNKIFGPIASIAAVISNFTVETNAQYDWNVQLSVQEVAINTYDGSGENIMAGSPGSPVDFLAKGTTLTFQEKNPLVANGWSASGPGSYDLYKKNAANRTKMTAYNQVRGLSPTAVLKPENGPFKVALDVFQAISLVLFPEISTLDLGKIEVDKVPPDRLQ